jgi:hypothetical protein
MAPEFSLIALAPPRTLAPAIAIAASRVGAMGVRRRLDLVLSPALNCLAGAAQ